MAGWWSTRRFDLAEVSLIFVLVATIAAVAAITVMERAGLSYVTFSAAEEGAALKQRYGPARYSEHEEEWIIRDFFKEKRGGVFVDVGANHYQAHSNTYYLESALSWTGVAIDPQTVFAEDYLRHRPGTRYFAYFVSDTSDANATLYQVKENPLVASADRGFAERAGTNAKDAAYQAQEMTVPTVRLTDLLDRLGMARFDLLSIDVELAEPKVLAGFDIGRFRPSLVCIEAHPQVRQQILNYFAAHGYVLLGRYLRIDLRNLYFAPAADIDTGAGGR